MEHIYQFRNHKMLALHKVSPLPVHSTEDTHPSNSQEHIGSLESLEMLQ